MFQENNTLKFNLAGTPEIEKINSKEVNMWLEKNQKRMRELSVSQPMNWVEGNCMA